MELEKRGLPAVLLADDPFVRAGQTQARMLGVPELPVISLGKHTTTLERDGMRDRVDAMIETIVSGLVRRSVAAPPAAAGATGTASIREEETRR